MIDDNGGKLLEAILRLSDKVDDIKDSNHEIQVAYIEQAGEFKHLSSVLGELASKVATMESGMIERRVKDERLDSRVSRLECDVKEIKSVTDKISKHDARNEHERESVKWIVQNWPALAAVVAAVAALLKNSGQ